MGLSPRQRARHHRHRQLDQLTDPRYFRLNRVTNIRKRTLRVLAAPAVAILLLASCGTTEDLASPEPTNAGDTSPAPDEGGDASVSDEGAPVEFPLGGITGTN